MGKRKENESRLLCSTWLSSSVAERAECFIGRVPVLLFLAPASKHLKTRYSKVTAQPGYRDQAKLWSGRAPWPQRNPAVTRAAVLPTVMEWDKKTQISGSFFLSPTNRSINLSLVPFRSHWKSVCRNIWGYLRWVGWSFCNQKSFFQIQPLSRLCSSNSRDKGIEVEENFL